MALKTYTFLLAIILLCIVSADWAIWNRHFCLIHSLFQTEIIATLLFCGILPLINPAGSQCKIPFSYYISLSFCPFIFVTVHLALLERNFSLTYSNTWSILSGIAFILWFNSHFMYKKFYYIYVWVCVGVCVFYINVFYL